MPEPTTAQSGAPVSSDAHSYKERLNMHIEVPLLVEGPLLAGHYVSGAESATTGNYVSGPDSASTGNYISGTRPTGVGAYVTSGGRTDA